MCSSDLLPGGVYHRPPRSWPKKVRGGIRNCKGKSLISDQKLERKSISLFLRGGINQPFFLGGEDASSLLRGGLGAKWARAHGCPWGKGTCVGAAEYGHLAVLQWARAQRCPWDKLTCSFAARGGHLADPQVGTSPGVPLRK